MKKTIIHIEKKDFAKLNIDNVGTILFVNYNYPALLGGLDSFTKTKKQTIVSDIGMNGRCRDYIVRIR